VSGTKHAEAERQSHIELMREMGATEYDPIAPDQYLFRLDPAMKLSPLAHQLHTWILWTSIHVRKPGGRTAFAAWGGRRLGLTDASHDLGHDLPAISKAFNHELLSKGLVRVDEKKRIYPCGKVEFQRPTHRADGKNGDGEGKAKLFVQTTFPLYISRRLEEISESERQSFLRNHERLELAENDALAEAAAQVREQFAPLHKALLSTIAVVPEELEKRRHKKPKREPELRVSLQLEFPKFEFVQTTSNGRDGDFAHTTESGLYKPPNGSAHTTASLLTSSERIQSFSQSEVNPESVENPAAEQNKVAPAARPSGPDETLPDEVKKPNVVLAALHARFGYWLRNNDPLRTRWIELGAKLGIPDPTIVQWIHAKFDKKALGLKRIKNYRCLYDWAVAELPGWVEDHPRPPTAEERELRRQAAAAAGAGGEPFTAESFNAAYQRLKEKTRTR
jgi:hypothetical protein